MTPERFQRADDLFTRAAELDPAAREAFLEAECAGDAELLREVRALLESDGQAQGFVQAHFEAGVVAFEEHSSRPSIRVAGPYRLTRELGHGGMGTVYLGTRDDGRHNGEVAVKLVRPSMDTDFFLMRFKRERQALARLQHPNIARLLDSGTAIDGSPYIVMELVNGPPINAYCREHALDVAQILRLFVLVCRAVAHAHRQFIVHRDLKPGNILVESGGIPKLLDFGICKMLMGASDITLHSGDTLSTTHIMTPDYASPEQVRADPITVTSDVYSLGAVLYELLTGKRPHAIVSLTPQAVMKAVCDDDIVRPSVAAETAGNRGRARQLAGDLDNILMKAMQKEAARRYVSVDDLAADVQRVLDNEPVEAAPETSVYVAQKFVRRHRVPVTAGALAAIASIAGMIAYGRQASVARRESAESRAELAQGYLRLGELQGDVVGPHAGDSAGAIVSFRKGLTALESAGESRDIQLSRMALYRRLGSALRATSVADALKSYASGITIGESLYKQDSTDEKTASELAGLYEAFSRSLGEAGKAEASVQNALDALKISREIHARHPRDNAARSGYASALATAGTAQARAGRLEEARKLLVESTRLLDELCRDQPSNSAWQRERMFAYGQLGDATGAAAAFRSMLDAAEQLYRVNPDDQASAIDYGMAQARVAALPIEDREARLDLFAKAAALLEQAARRDPGNASIALNLATQRAQAGDLLAESGKLDDARAQFKKALETIEPRLDQNPSAAQVAIALLQRLGQDAAQRGSAALATNYEARALEVGGAGGSRSQEQLALALARSAAASIEDKLSRTAEARKLREQALATYRSFQSDAAFDGVFAADMKKVEEALGARKESKP